MSDVYTGTTLGLLNNEKATSFRFLVIFRRSTDNRRSFFLSQVASSLLFFLSQVASSLLFGPAEGWDDFRIQGSTSVNHAMSYGSPCRGTLP